MSFITEIINDIKKCCCPFLIPRQPHHPPHIITSPLIEMKNINQPSMLSIHRAHSRKRSASFNQPLSHLDANHNDLHLQEPSQNMVQSSGPQNESSRKNIFFQNKLVDKQSIVQQKPLILKRVDSVQMESSMRKSGSQSSFQTIKSSGSRPFSRRNFKMLRTSSSFYAKHRSNQDQFFSAKDSEESSLKRGLGNRMMIFKYAENEEDYRNGIEKMNTWIKKQYQSYGSRLFKPVISEITKMKLETKDVFNSMVHRLEDYYTFYYEDNNFERPDNLARSLSKHYASNSDLTSFTYEQQNQQMLCSVSLGSIPSDIEQRRGCRYMSLIIIPYSSLGPLQFLQWFSKLQVQSSLHCFNKIEHIENSQIVDEKITLEYPLVRVEQFNEKLLGKETFVLARQIEVVNFQNQEDRQTLLEVCFEAINQHKCFERLLRVTAEQNQGSRVQIYIESSQKIAKRQAPEQFGKRQLQQSNKAQMQKNTEFSFFEQRWKRFEQRLNKYQVINKKSHQVFTN